MTATTLLRRHALPTALALLAAALPTATTADEDAWNAKFQSTYVWQTKPAFDAAYSGPNSLSPRTRKAIRSPPPRRSAGAPGVAASCTSTRNWCRACRCPI